MTSFDSLDAFLARGRSALSHGPIALILIEDFAEVESTLAHHLRLGFRQVIAFAPEALSLPHDLAARITEVRLPAYDPDAAIAAVNAVIARAAGQWLHYCYNAEYLFFPFCETRSVGEMLAFHAEERREAMLSYVIDLYAADLEHFPDAVSPESAHLDASGYYALARRDPATGHPKERQLDFFGGLRWRFEEHVPRERRRIDRIALFRATTGLRLLADHRFNVEEYNTYACPWHNNLTAAVCSFRAAKALRRNPGSADRIDSFLWHNSVPFSWHSQQMLDLGLIEPGQWF